MRTRERVAHGSPLFMPLSVKTEAMARQISFWTPRRSWSLFEKGFLHGSIFPVLLRTLFTVTILLYTVKFHIVKNRD